MSSMGYFARRRIFTMLKFCCWLEPELFSRRDVLYIPLLFEIRRLLCWPCYAKKGGWRSGGVEGSGGGGDCFPEEMYCTSLFYLKSGDFCADPVMQKREGGGVEEWRGVEGGGTVFQKRCTVHPSSIWNQATFVLTLLCKKGRVEEWRCVCVCVWGGGGGVDPSSSQAFSECKYVVLCKRGSTILSDYYRVP